MSYNKSRACVNRHLKYLTDMLGSKTNRYWPSDEPEGLAQKIREAMSASQHHPDFSHFHVLKEHWRLRAKNAWVEAEFVGPPEDLTLSHATQRMEIPEATDHYGVAGACIKFGEMTEEIYFPNAILTRDVLLHLHKWGLSSKVKGPPWHIINHDDKGITMTRKEEAEDFFWRPEE